ncbi:hypothetical protein Avbf_03379 [Armadillidium vulgare]|nr:hypothetical protein Avbf_03379 [Armadillidium vulgare]
MSKSCFRTGKYLFNHIVYTFRTYENSRSYSSLFITNSKLYSTSFINKLDIAINYINQNFIHSSSVCGIRFDGRHAEGRRALKSRKEESDYVETTFSDNIRGFGLLFPDEETPNQLYNGVKFSDLPIVHIKVSRNNTIMTVSDAKGASQLIRTCGMDGFKNAKKGTNVAAQVTAQSIGLVRKLIHFEGVKFRKFLVFIHRIVCLPMNKFVLVTNLASCKFSAIWL